MYKITNNILLNFHEFLFKTYVTEEKKKKIKPISI